MRNQHGATVREPDQATRSHGMNAEDRSNTNNTEAERFFLSAYRDHLLAELAEVERRLQAKAQVSQPLTFGFES